jgi:hypothetical protein
MCLFSSSQVEFPVFFNKFCFEHLVILDEGSMLFVDVHMNAIVAKLVPAHNDVVFSVKRFFLPRLELDVGEDMKRAVLSKDGGA